MNAVTAAADLSHWIGLAKSAGSQFGTNIFLTGDAIEQLGAGSLFAREFDGAVIVLRREPRFDRLYYAAAGAAPLESALAQLEWPAGSVLVSDLVGRKDEIAPWAAAFTAAGFSHSTTLLRMQRIQTQPAPAARAGLDVELARAEDAAEIQDVLLANFDPYLDQIPPIAETRQAAASGTVLLIRAGGRIAALLYYDRTGWTTHLRYWLVLPDHQTEGFAGDRLIRRYFRDCAGCRRFLLWVHERNTRVVPIYRWYGYKTDSLIDAVFLKRL